MNNKRVYYPLHGTKGRYRKEVVNLLSVVFGIENNFILAGIETGEERNLCIYESPEELMLFIKSLPNKSWLLSWDLDYIPSILPELLSKYHLRGVVSEQLTGLDLICKDENGREKIIYLVSLFPFYLTNVNRALYSINSGCEYIDQKLIDDNPARYILSMLDGLHHLWEKLKTGLKTLFNVHPSKSPGATSLKTWRRYIKKPLFTKGQKINDLCYKAIPPAALFWVTGVFEQVFLYDINAAYPSIMKVLKFPRTLTAFINREPPSNKWIALVRCSYKSKVKASPFWHRLSNGGILRPDIAENVVIPMTYIDADLYSETGEFVIHEFIEGVYWYDNEEDQLFKDWVDDTERFIKINPDFKPALKVVTRALHSKFRPSKNKSPLADLKIVKPEEVINSGDRVRDIYPLPDGRLAALIYKEDVEEVFKPYVFPAFDALIMAAARYEVYTSQDENTIYIDTDCIISKEKRPDLKIGNNYGDWKLNVSGRAHIAGLRLYSIDYKSKAAGIHALNSGDLTRAIMDIAITKEIETNIKKIERTSFTNLVIGVNIGKKVISHKIKNAPMVMCYLRDEFAYIIKGPIKRAKTENYKRVLSCDNKTTRSSLNENKGLLQQAQSIINKIREGGISGNKIIN